MNEIAELNTTQTELAIAKIENNLVTNMAKNNINNNKKLNEIDIKLNNSNEKLDEFQNVVVALTEAVKTVEIKVWRHETEILEFKVKVSQISKDYIKKEELGRLMNECSAATSYALPDVSTLTGRGFQLKQS